MEFYKNTVKEETFKLLKELMADPSFENFFLVGGTSIALRIGHRKSIDLDLFTRDEIKTDYLYKHLKEIYGFEERYRAKNTLKGDIRGVYIDCNRYDYPLLKPADVYEGIRVASLEDIAAMKISAITDDGTRLKDFIDVAFLSEYMSLNHMLESYKRKYDENNLFSPVKALTYFDEIDFNNEPVELIGKTFKWTTFEKRLIEMTKNPDKVFREEKCKSRGR